MSTPSIDRAIRNLVTWAGRGKWKPLQREFYATHFEPVADGIDISDDILTLLPGEATGVVGVFILESFFTALFGERGELNVVDDYLKRRGWRESVPGRSYLKALRNSTISLYEVVDIVPGRYVTARDLIHGGDVARIEEKPGSEEAAPGDRLAARVVAVHGENRFTGAILHFRPELSRQLLKVFEELAGNLEREMRTSVEKGRMTVPVTPEMARELMVRTPNFSRILAQFWMLDVAGRARAPAPWLRDADDDLTLR